MRTLSLIALILTGCGRTADEPGPEPVTTTTDSGSVSDSGTTATLPFDGIASASWDGGVGLVATFTPADWAASHRLEVTTPDGTVAGTAQLAADASSGSVTGLADGEYLLRVVAVGPDGSENDGGRTLTQLVGANRITFRSNVLVHHAADVWGAGDTVVLAGHNSGASFYVYDIADPAAPSLLTTVVDEGWVKDAKIADGLLFTQGECGCAADSPEWDAYDRVGARIYDFSNPAAPTLLSEIGDPAMSVHNLSYGDGYLYLSDNISNGVLIYDVRDPAAPVYLTTWLPGEGTVHDQAWVDGKLYVAHWKGFTILDVADPANPVEITSYLGIPSCHNIWPSEDGNTVFTTSETLGGPLTIVDVSDPADPRPVTVWSASDATMTHNVHVRGDLAYIAYYKKGLQVVDISDPAFPELVGWFDTWASFEHPLDTAGLAGDTAGLAGDTAGLAGDTATPSDTAVTDTGAPGIVHDHGEGKLFAGAWGVWPYGEHVVVSDTSHGLFVLDYVPPTVTAE